MVCADKTLILYAGFCCCAFSCGLTNTLAAVVSTSSLANVFGRNKP